MQRRIALLALFLAFAASPPAYAAARDLPHGMQWKSPGVVRLVRSDHGGFLANYLVELERLKTMRIRQLQIDATCASACTVFLRLGNRVCVTDRARLGFHRMVLWNPGTGLSRHFEREREFNDKFLRSLPGRIRNWRALRGGLPWRMVWLQDEEAARRVGRCR